jgi:AcrR family transcriptional regulator
VPATTKDRILEATELLFRRYGYTGTGLKQIVADANAPFGSVYHFFPGGKAQLGEEVIRRAGRMYEELVMAVWDAADDPLLAARDVFAGAAEVLRVTDFLDPCPIGVVALEVASSNEALRLATADVFASWVVAISRRLTAAGVGEHDAHRLSHVLIQLLEGAFMVARATRATDTVDAAGEAAVTLIAAALGR